MRRWPKPSLGTLCLAEGPVLLLEADRTWASKSFPLLLLWTERCYRCHRAHSGRHRLGRER